jgi:hypothetical protein
MTKERIPLPSVPVVVGSVLCDPPHPPPHPLPLCARLWLMLFTMTRGSLVSKTVTVLGGCGRVVEWVGIVRVGEWVGGCGCLRKWMGPSECVPRRWVDVVGGWVWVRWVGRWVWEDA